MAGYEYAGGSAHPRRRPRGAWRRRRRRRRVDPRLQYGAKRTTAHNIGWRGNYSLENMGNLALKLR